MKGRASLVVLAALLVTVAAEAQTQRSGADPSTRLVQQVQQLTADKATLQSENERLKKELESAKAELKQANAGRTALEAKARNLQAAASRSTAADEGAEQALERNRAQMQELIAKFRETAQTLRDVEADRAQAKATLAQREREYKVCVDRNAEFYHLNDEILTRLEDRGFWSSFASSEPFTGLARTRLENLVDDYRYRADELKLQSSGQNVPTSP